MSCSRTSAAILLFLAVTLAWSPGCAWANDGSEGRSASPEYWGAGIYMTNDAGTLYDHARWDWMIVRFSGADTDPEMIEQVNQFLTVNPNQKYLVRLYPNVSTSDGAHFNFLHYRFDPAVRQLAQEQLRKQIRLVREKIAKPENVIAYTFMEELPGNFGFEGLRLASAAELPPQVAHYREQIQTERGEDLKWNEPTWRWLGKAFEETINEIHDLIRQEAGESARVLFWPHLGYPALEHADASVDFARREPSVTPFSYANVLKPGRCDGIIVSLLNETTWDQILRAAEKANGIVIAQLSHGGYMRQRSWEQNLAMLDDARKNSPAYAGYFFFCEPQGQPNPMDKPDAAETLRTFTDRLVQHAKVPGERGNVLKVTHPDDPQRPFVGRASSYLFCVDHPTHGSKGLAVKPGQTLKWSVHVKAENIKGAEGGVMTLVWDRSRGGSVQPTVVTATGTHDWKTYEGTVTVPEDTVGGRVYLGLRGATGTVWFDDLRITDEAGDDNLIENGDFEDVEMRPLHWKNWIIDDHSLVLAHWRVFCEQQKIGTDLPRGNE